jgi:hypothetical protein
VTNSIQLQISNEVHEIEIREFRGQRVLTLRDIDALHKRTAGTSSRNFQNNREYFITDEDCFVVQPSQKNEFRCLGIPNRGLTLITESGYLMLVKSFTDKLAWSVQRQLVKSYFKAKTTHVAEVVSIPQIPTSYEDIMIFALQSQKELKAELALLKQDKQEQSDEIRKLSLVVDNEIWVNDHQKADIRDAVNKRVGYLKSQTIDAHFQGVYTDMNNFFNVPKYDKIKRGDYELALDFIKGWYPKKNNEAN